MAINIGQTFPHFRFKLSKNLINHHILTEGTSGISTGQHIDTNKKTIVHTGAVSIPLYNIQVVPERYYGVGYETLPNLSSSNTNIATLDESNNTNYVSTGYFSILGNYIASSPYFGQSEEIQLSHISGAASPSTTITYTPDSVNADKHVLVVYNNNSNDSTNLKTFYTGTRPQFSTANVLAISCYTGESIPYSVYQTGIQQPIVNYLTGVSGVKPIRYIIMLTDIPTRISDYDHFSVPYKLSQAYRQLGLRNGTNYTSQDEHFSLGQFEGFTCLVSYINFGNLADCSGYINRISRNQTNIYLSGNGKNTGYYFEDYNNIYQTVFPTFVSGRYLQPILDESPSASYIYRGTGTSFITTGNNVLGFSTWGANNFRGPNYANNGSIKWGGTGNWYIMTTVESFNGQRGPNPGGQGNFIDWFSSGAFGGTGYENCPIGAVCHVEEPTLAGVINNGFYKLWNRGWPFIECAWQARATPSFLCVGDPLIVR